MTQKLRVGVLLGGRSGEHEVSLVSAGNVMNAMDPAKYEIVPIGISKDGTWLSGPDVVRQLTDASKLPPRLRRQASDRGKDLMGFLGHSLSVPEGSRLSLDVVFPVLHGPMGEDGTVQGFLELAGVAYVGNEVTASAAAMDKVLAKDVFMARGLPTLPSTVVSRKAWRSDRKAVLDAVEAEFGYPMFVKPANLGSSVGITKAHDRTELPGSLDEAARFDRKILVEVGIDAREIEVAVLGNDTPQASVAGEIIPSREFYSYAAKYIDDSSELLIPAPLAENQSDNIRAMALAAFVALDCAGLARVDFLVDKATAEVYLNEINTMPGFTRISMYPKLWEASGIGYSELIDRLIELALERRADKEQSTSFFDTSHAD